MEIKSEILPITALLDAYDFKQQSFFSSLASGAMDLTTFTRTQQQFYHAVVFFARPLAMVAASIPDYQERVGIVENVWEEHGKGDITRTHGASFTEFLRRLTGQEHILSANANHGALEFNQTLMAICQTQDYLQAVAALGMIERMFADISLFIGTQVIERQWLKPEQLIHYNLHQELDHLHAEDFFAILRKYYHLPEKKMVIDSGLTIGAKTFLKLYQDLYLEACE
jgi:pyrroloquinoline-quinone synthase